MKHEATVIKIVQQTPDVRTIFFTVNGGVMPFVAGQYVSVYFEDLATKAGKAYSLSSTPWDERMSITVKDIGVFSGRLTSLLVGDVFTVSEPYGFFNVRNRAPIVALVAGVGISPVWSIVQDELNSLPGRSVRMLCSASNWEGLVMRDELEELRAQSPNFVIDFFTTKQPHPQAHNRRMHVQDDVSDSEAAGATFYLCGSQEFVRSLWRQLMERGVDEQRIATEIFFESTL